MSFVANLIINVADKFKSKYGTDEAVERTTKAVKSSLRNIAVEVVRKAEPLSPTCEYDNCGIKLRKKNTFNGKVYCNKHFKSIKSAFAKDAKVRCVHVFGQNSGTPGERCKAQAIDGRFCNRHKPKRNENKQQTQTIKTQKPQVQESEDTSFDFSSEGTVPYQLEVG